MSSPTDSTQSADLLDLESVSYASWNAAEVDLNDPEWLPQVKSMNSSNNASAISAKNSKKCAKSATTPARATKRRNSSQTSELELQIEIEASLMLKGGKRS